MSSIGVVGMWHLGTVTAACLADAGYTVIGFDADPKIIQDLNHCRLPVSEPGLEEMVRTGLNSGRLRFSNSYEDLSAPDILWVTYDTPVDDQDIADVDFVVGNVCRLFPHLRADALIIVSSQLPMGSVGKLEKIYREKTPGGSATFACLPENLRLGKAIFTFTKPDRVVAGVRSGKDQTTIEQLLKPFTRNVVWMSVESAEMTKHAINAFLATSVAFANELASICEKFGADAGEVEKGLKSDVRIGPGAYLKPGGPFAGGTLARDTNYLLSFGEKTSTPVHLINGVIQSNNAHKFWIRRRMSEILGNLRERRIAVLGLTYKPGTDTLRRSSAVETCGWLSREGATVRSFDPAVTALPGELAGIIKLCSSIEEALDGARAAFIATEWPQFRAIAAEDIVRRMDQPIIFDPSRFLAHSVGNDKRIKYITVGSVV